MMVTFIPSGRNYGNIGDLILTNTTDKDVSVTVPPGLLLDSNDPKIQDGILSGLRVVEFEGRIAAPLVGMFLAEQGAEVVRVVGEANRVDLLQTVEVEIEAVREHPKRNPVRPAPGQQIPRSGIELHGLEKGLEVRAR